MKTVSFCHRIRNRIAQGLAALALIGLSIPQALACTAFRMPVANDVLIGRNFDWDYGHGLMIVNKRGVAKSVLPLHASDTASWVSRYGSLTFNQAGRELPYGGVNEKGLMIAVLWLGWTAWPVTPAPSINEVQWIQYQLDQRATVQDLIAHIDDVRIVPDFAKVHFIVCDPSGECATVEGLGNHIEVHNGATMPVATLTNDNYSTSLTYADRFLSNSNCVNVPKTSSSLDRFARASCLAAEPQSSPTVATETARAHAILNSVAQKNYTKWQLVYDLTAKTVSIVTTDSPAEKVVSLSQFDFSCAKPAQILDLNFTAPAGAAKDVSALFTDYTEAANRSIVEKSLLTGFAHLPQTVVNQVVAFPDAMKCVNP